MPVAWPIQSIRPFRLRQGNTFVHAESRELLFMLEGPKAVASEALCRQYFTLGRAMMRRETLQYVLAGEDAKGFRWWCRWAIPSRWHEHFRKLDTANWAHSDGVVSFLATRVTDGLIEAINDLLQLAKRMARGFRSYKHFQVMA